MRSVSSIAAIAAFVATARAGDAPIANSDLTNGIVYTATLANTGVEAITGSVIGAVSPDGSGTNFQVTFYNLPGGGGLSYGLYTGRISDSDCNTAGAILDPYGGVTGSACKNDPASCQVGDLSDKHGDAQIISGGTGTGYFAANYMDKYVSIDPSNDAFFGNGSVVVKDSTGAAVGCANFINQVKLSTEAAGNKTSSSTTMSSTMPAGQSATAGSQQASSSTSAGLAARTAAPIVGVLGMALLLI